MGRVQTARYDGLIRRLFSIKGFGSLLAETLGDAFPVLDLENLPIELLKLAGWEVGMAGAQTTSPVGQTVGAQLLNPVGSGKIVVPTTAIFSTNTTGLAFLGLTAVALATATTGRHRDSREGVLARTTAQVRHGNNPAGATNAGRIRFTANENLFLSDSNGLAVLAPGTAFTITTGNTNVLLNSMFFWRERVAEPSELNF